MQFEVIPAIDIKEAEVVQLVGGNLEKSEGFGDPLEIANHWINEGATHLHLIDLDGAINGEMRNISFIKKIVELNNVKIQVGGGIRSLEIVEDLVSFGVDRIILGTAVFDDSDIIEKVKEKFDIEVFVSIDCKGKEIMVKGWKKSSGLSLEDGIEKFEKNDVDGFLLTDINKEGKMRGIDKNLFEYAYNQTKSPIIASGGISSIDDLCKLKKIGISGAVVGSALYKKNFKLENAINSLKNL